MVICAFVGSLAADGNGVLAAHPARSKTSTATKHAVPGLGLILTPFYELRSRRDRSRTPAPNTPLPRLDRPYACRGGGKPSHCDGPDLTSDPCDSCGRASARACLRSPAAPWTNPGARGRRGGRVL